MKLFLTLIHCGFFFHTFSQNNSVCYVKYHLSIDNSTDYVQWFDNLKVIISFEAVQINIKEFPVIENGKLFRSSDTIKYRKEYLEQFNGINAAARQLRQPVSERYYNSNIVPRTQYLKNGKEKYLVIDTIPEMPEWTIENDTLSILGFKCQKAAMKFKGLGYIAYFSTDLPFPAGPKNFRGLPGLILKVTSENNKIDYVATEIIFPYKGFIPKLEKDGKQISQKQFLLLVDKANISNNADLLKLSLTPNSSKPN
ncbi:MAG: GLPGLI family protein [Chitinophagaceae bacterium]